MYIDKMKHSIFCAFVTFLEYITICGGKKVYEIRLTTLFIFRKYKIHYAKYLIYLISMTIVNGFLKSQFHISSSFIRFFLNVHFNNSILFYKNISDNRFWSLQYAYNFNDIYLDEELSTTILPTFSNSPTSLLCFQICFMFWMIVLTLL